MTAATVKLNEENVLEVTETIEEVPSDYKLLYEQQQAELESLKNLVAATRVTQQSAGIPDKDRKPVVSAERARGLVGELAWSKMTDAQRVASLGIDPGTLDHGLLRRAFGRGGDSRLAQDLYKTSPFKYRTFKEAAIALNIYAA